jgi:hypothetical protein
MNMFIDTNNSIYVAATSLSRVLVWANGASNITRVLNTSLNLPEGIFVTINGSIYIDNVASNGRVDYWAPNATVPMTAMTMNGSCIDLFVDVYGSLYCSNVVSHQIFKLTDLNSPGSRFTIAGNMSAGSTATRLNQPRGIFVDTKLNFYVADSMNNRIQLFYPGSRAGITVASNSTIGLTHPVDVVLDGNGYLFIAEIGKERVLAQNDNGFRCILGCNGTTGSAAHQLSNPRSLAFDTHGNIFLVDRHNKRIQRFQLINSTCRKSSYSC